MMVDEVGLIDLGLYIHTMGHWALMSGLAFWDL